MLSAVFLITMLVPRRANAVCPYVIYICYILSAINIQYARCNINHYDHYSSRTDNSHKCSGFHSFSEFQFLSYEEISCCQRNACDSQCKTCIKPFGTLVTVIVFSPSCKSKLTRSPGKPCHIETALPLTFIFRPS